MKKIIYSIVVFFSIGVSFLATSKTEPITLLVSNAWIAMAPPVTKISVGYMTISNNSPHDLLIEKITSDAFEHIEIHQTIHQNGIAKMLFHKEILIKANTQFSFKPDSYHLMLFKPTRQLNLNDKIKFFLTIKKRPLLTIVATVKER